MSLSIGNGVGTLSPADANLAIAPFSERPVPEVVSNGTSELTITNIDVFRNLDPVTPPPPGFGPPPHGVNTLVPVYSFVLTLADLSQQTINVTVNGQGCRILHWEYEAGVASWVPFGSESQTAQSATLNLMVLPTCTDWFNGFGSPGNGVNGTVYAMTVFDDGSGPALCVGGNFTGAGGTPALGVARWNGSHWSALGTGLATVTSLAVFDDGTGPHLYAGGQFGTVNGVPLNRVAKWTGNAWVPLGAGMDNGVWCMTVFDDGSGPELFVGGDFTSAGGAPTDHLASWNGSRWRTWNGGPSMRSEAALAYDSSRHQVVLFGGLGNGTASDTWLRGSDGWSLASASGAAGSRYGATMAFDSLRNRVIMFGARGGSYSTLTAYWDGTTWVAIPGSPPNLSRYYSQIVYDAARDRVVLFGGTRAGAFVNDTWEFDGTSWAQVETAHAPITRTQHGIAYDPERQRVVIFGGQNLALGALADTWEYDGVDWTQVANSGPAARLGSSMTYDTLRHRVVLSGGINSNPINDTWAWNGQTWTMLDPGAPSMPIRTRSPMVYDASMDRIVQRVESQTWLFDGTSWSTAVEGGPNGTVNAMTAYSSGSGTDLYVGGAFNTAGGVPAANIARWSGGGWGAASGGLSDAVYALAEFNGSLFAGGAFDYANNTPASRIARWDGASWSSVGSHGGAGGASGTIYGLGAVDIGGGPALYALGSFGAADGVITNGIARWSGAVWSSVSNGLNSGAIGRVAIGVQDAGTSVMYIGGTLTSAGGHSSRNFAKWGGHCEAPTIVSQPVGMAAVFGQSIDLTVEATGVAPLTYQWRRNGNPILSTPPHIIGADTPTLSIQTWSLSDEGVYDVVVTNPNGSVTSDGAMVTVPLGGVVDPVTVLRVIYPPQPVPEGQGGGTFTALFDPLISSTSDVTILGVIDGFRTLDRWSGGDIIVEYRAGAQAPGVPEGDLFVHPNNGSAFRDYVSGADGSVCFTSDLQGPDVSGPGNRRGMWFGGPAGTSLIARSGSIAPGAEPLVFPSNLRGGVINNSGLAAFASPLSMIPDGPYQATGVWTWDDESGESLVALTGRPAPSTTGAITFLSTRVRVNDSRDVLFMGRKDTVTGYTYSSVTDTVLWLFRDGDYRIVAQSGDPAPGFDPQVNIESSNDTDMFLNEAGEVLFDTYVAGPSGFRQQAIYRADGAGLSLVLVNGQEAPGAGPGATMVNPVIRVFNDDRKAVVYSLIAHPPEDPSGPIWGYWFIDDSGVTPLLMSDAGHLEGSPPNMIFSGVTTVALNSNDQLLIGCELSWGSTYNAIYGWTPDQGLFPVVVPGTQLSAAPGEYLTVTDAYLSSELGGSSGPTSRSLNDAGDLAFQTNFTNGSNGVFVGHFIDFLGGYVNCPFVGEDPAPVTVRVGDPIRLEATVVGAPPLSYRWRLSDTPLMDDGVISGAATLSLTISPARLADSGTYTLDASNACGSVSTDPVAVTVYCAADWNVSGVINSQDFFDFLAAFFLGQADFNADGVTNSQDFFDFLAAFFAGC